MQPAFSAFLWHSINGLLLFNDCRNRIILITHEILSANSNGRVAPSSIYDSLSCKWMLRFVFTFQLSWDCLQFLFVSFSPAYIPLIGTLILYDVFWNVASEKNKYRTQWVNVVILMTTVSDRYCFVIDICRGSRCRTIQGTLFFS